MRVRAPGRVNLIGDHTDYAGGLVLPVAIDLETVIEGERGGELVSLTSADEPGAVQVPLDLTDPSATAPAWGRYVAGVVATVTPRAGFTGRVTTTLPVGAGLSSSAALEVATALALGFGGTPLELARACQRAEHVATGVPCGIMDQLACVAGVAGHALLIDCGTLDIEPVPLPPDVEIVVVHSGQARTLDASAYAERRAQVEAAPGADPVLQRRARHVRTENERVRAFADALLAGRTGELGELLVASHASLRDDFEVSTPVLDALVERLCATPGVLGARLTGAGFGGCVVALVRPGTPVDGWRVRAVDGASVDE